MLIVKWIIIISTCACIVSVVFAMITHTCVALSLVEISVYLLFKIIGRIDSVVVYKMHSWALWVTTPMRTALCSN